MVKAYDSRQIGCGFEACHILDGCKQSLAITYTLKIKTIKVAKWGTPKKNILTN